MIEVRFRWQGYAVFSNSGFMLGTRRKSKQRLLFCGIIYGEQVWAIFDEFIDLCVLAAPMRKAETNQ